MPSRTARSLAPRRPPEGVAHGKEARRRLPRSSHGRWEPAGDRADPVAVLQAEDAGRVAELVPIRYGRMLASPLAFYRGAAAIMAADLAGTPDSGIPVQLCGDAHLSNFGVFMGPERRLLFDIDDFDETHAGPWEWDVKRLAASLEVAGRDRGFKPRRRRTIVGAGARGYREAMRSFAGMGHLAVWYARLPVDDILTQHASRVTASSLRTAERTVAKAKGRDGARAVSRLTTVVDGRPRFVSSPPLIMRLEDLDGDGRGDDEAELSRLLAGYRRSLAPELRGLAAAYRPVDIARKVVGVGSVGTRCWVVLLEGRDEADRLVLQAKEAGPSVLEPYTGPSPYANAGQRVVRGQRAMQAAGDLLLGWHRVTGPDGRDRDFYVRQLWDGKGSAAVETMADDAMEVYAGLCGSTLARAHARSGDRVAIAAYLGGGDAFDRAMVAFADAYADRNERDFRALEEAVEAGRVPVAATSGS